MKRSNFLLFINTLGSGGAQRQLVLLARELSKKNLDVTLIHYGDSEYMTHMLGEESVKIIRINPRKFFGKMFLLIELIFKILQIRPLYLISFIDTPNIISGLACLFDKKIIWIPSERNTCVDEKWLDTKWRYYLYKRARKVVSNSQTQNAWLGEKLPSLKHKLMVVNNGVASELFSSPGKTPMNPVIYKFLILGRVSHQKNPFLLLRSIRLMDENLRSSVRFDWYGEEDPQAVGMLEDLKNEISKDCLPFNFHSARSNTTELLDDADALVLCSVFEGTPNVVLESMARSKFVISSNVSDIPEILDYGNRGLIFKSNDEQQLCQAIISFMNMTKDEVAKKVELAYEFAVKKYDGVEMTNEFLTAAGYKSL